MAIVDEFRDVFSSMCRILYLFVAVSDVSVQMGVPSRAFAPVETVEGVGDGGVREGPELAHVNIQVVTLIERVWLQVAPKFSKSQTFSEGKGKNSCELKEQLLSCFHTLTTNKSSMF